MLNSSFGLQNASLDCVLGTMSTLTRKHLANKQKDSLRVAKRRHDHQTNVFDGSRRKISTDANVFDWRVPGPQREPLVSDQNQRPGAYVGGGRAAGIEVDEDLDLDSDLEQE